MASLRAIRARIKSVKSTQKITKAMKLVSEQLCVHYGKDYGIDTRVVRFHNIFGPEGTWSGGREKAPAASRRAESARSTTPWSSYAAASCDRASATPTASSASRLQSASSRPAVADSSILPQS